MEQRRKSKEISKTMSRDDERPDHNPGEDDNQGDHPAFDPDKPPADPTPSGSEDGYERGVGKDHGENSWNSPKRYQPTSHPEDAPGGFNPTPGGAYGYGATGGTPRNNYPPHPGGTSGYSPYGQPYSGYGPGTGGAGDDGWGQPGTALEQADGHVDIMRAVRFGFKTLFANPVLWILGTVVVGVAFMFLSITLSMVMMAVDQDATVSGDPFAPTNIIMNLLIGIFAWVLVICVTRGALTEVDGKRAVLADFFRVINIGQTILLILITTAFGVLFATLLQFDAPNIVAFNETTGEMSVDEAVLGRMVLYMVVATLVSPLHEYWIYYVCDGRENAVGAIRHGFVDAARNYGKLLLFTVVSFFVAIVAIPLTLMLGLVVLLPAAILIAAHIYRQISGGKIPVEQRP